MDDREIRSDSKLKGDALTEEQHQELWDLRYPAGETTPMGLEDIAATEVPRICSVTCAPSTLSEYYKWAKLKRSIEEREREADQAMEMYAAKNPDASQEKLRSIGQRYFSSKSIAEDDLAGWVKVQMVAEKRAAREFDERKFQQSIKSKQEAGLDAVFEEIKGNAQAEALFAKMTEVIKKSWES